MQISVWQWKAATLICNSRSVHWGTFIEYWQFNIIYAVYREIGLTPDWFVCFYKNAFAQPTTTTRCYAPQSLAIVKMTVDTSHHAASHICCVSRSTLLLYNVFIVFSFCTVNPFKALYFCTLFLQFLLLSGLLVCFVFFSSFFFQLAI